MQKTNGAHICLFPVIDLALSISQASQSACADDYWLLTGSGYSLPAQLTITSVLGDTVAGSPCRCVFSGNLQASQAIGILSRQGVVVLVAGGADV